MVASFKQSQVYTKVGLLSEWCIACERFLPEKISLKMRGFLPDFPILFPRKQLWLLYY